MGIGWDITRGLFGATTAAGRSIATGAAQGAAMRGALRGGAAVQRGLVGPWDDVPSGAADFLDYSGVATPGEMRIPPWSFPLGRYVLPRSTRLRPEWPATDEIGITADLANRHSVVYAPTQVGKTTSIIAPWIHAALEQGYLVVTLDLKGGGDLLGKVEQVAAARGALPDVAITDFDCTRPNRSASWNWIRGLGDDAALEAAAAAIVGRKEGEQNREFWLRDLNWMRGLLEMAHATGLPWTVGALLALLEDHARFATLTNNAAPARARARLGSLVFIPADDYYTKVQFLSTYLEVLNTPGWNRVTKHGGLSMEDLHDEGGLVVVTAPLADGALSEAVSGLFLSQFLTAQLQRFTTRGRPVLLVLDEAPRLQGRLDLPRLMATSASSGMSVLLALQEVNDIKEEGDRETILANCATHVLMGGAGPRTTRYFSDRLGKRTVARRTHSTSYGNEGRSFQTGTQSSEVDVLGRNELASPPHAPYGAIVHSYEVSHKPFLVDLGRPDLLGA